MAEVKKLLEYVVKLSIWNAQRFSIIGFAEHQEKATYGWGYKLTLTKNNNNAVLKKAPGGDDVKNAVKTNDWYVPHHTPSMDKKTIISKLISDKTSTEFQFLERFLFMNDVHVQNLWILERGNQKGVNVRFWTIVGFHQRDSQNSENINSDTFGRVSATSAECRIGAEKCPDASIFLNYDDEVHSHGYGQLSEAFRSLTEDDVLQ